MSQKLRLAVLFGGCSTEYPVSLQSAGAVLTHLDREKYELYPLGITRQGRWLLYTGPLEALAGDSWLEDPRFLCPAVLSPDRETHGILVLDPAGIRTIAIDAAFPVLHGKNGEDGTVQGLLELAGLPYVGCGVLGSAVCMDKISTKIFVDQLGIRQAGYVTDIARDLSELEHTVEQVEEKLGYPVFVKPSNAGSSCGVSKACDREELKRALQLAKEHDTRVLIEEMICGHEVECAVLGGNDLRASKVGEVQAAAEFYDYEAKYHNAESKTVIDPPEIPAEAKEKVRENAVEIFKAVSGFGLSRVDFFIENETNEVVFNEINTLPGFTNISMYPMLCNDMGLSISELIDRLIETAFERE